ncbi:MAG: hypothetical protein Q4C56_04035 [Peptococcaceae bacterium]|nr:hypothetical protein [Peptococcaceae bacterium]
MPSFHYEPTFTYNPSKITDGGTDQMRFELGDTVTDMGGISSALSDEEYGAILAKYGENWRRAKLKCLEAIVMKLSFEVNTSVDGLSYSLDARYERWKAMLDEAKREQQALGGAPRAGNPESLAPHHGTPYFYDDLHANRRKF